MRATNSKTTKSKNSHQICKNHSLGACNVTKEDLRCSEWCKNRKRKEILIPFDVMDQDGAENKTFLDNISRWRRHRAQENQSTKLVTKPRRLGVRQCDGQEFLSRGAPNQPKNTKVRKSIPIEITGLGRSSTFVLHLLCVSFTQHWQDTKDALSYVLIGCIYHVRILRWLGQKTPNPQRASPPSLSSHLVCWLQYKSVLLTWLLHPRFHSHIFSRLLTSAAFLQNYFPQTVAGTKAKRR